ncbi:MAG: hypothetical protein QXX17_05845 [Conexivisphaerales archaeon]
MDRCEMLPPALYAIAGISFDLASLIIGAAAGAAVAGLTLYFSSIRRRHEAPKVANLELGHGLPEKLVSKAEIEEARRELKLMKMEREYLSTALARIYEAEAKGLINKEERMALSQKYKVQLKEVEDKISRAQTIVDVADLEDAKAELLNLVNQKISQIDARLEDLKQRITPLIPPIEKIVQPEIAQAQPKEKKEKTEEVAKKPEIIDDKLRKVVQDVNEVMAKLEQMDLEE